MRIHCFQHVPFEGPGVIAEFAAQRGFEFSYTRLYETFVFPMLMDIDMLLIMGGPMGVYDEDEYPWIIAEKEYIKAAIDDGKKVLGICLGSQLIASALGAKVYPNRYKEIGFYPIKLTQQALLYKAFTNFPKEIVVFHWHGDTYDLPIGSKLIASSEACTNQAFQFGEKVIGLQFHFEVTNELVNGLINFGRKELVLSDYIQNAEEIYSQISHLDTCNKLMFELLDNWLNSRVSLNAMPAKSDIENLSRNK